MFLAYKHPLLSHKWACQDSNLEPIGYEPTALPLSYKPPMRK